MTAPEPGSKVRMRFEPGPLRLAIQRDRKSTRLNSSHLGISYAVFCFTPSRARPSFPTRRSSDLLTGADVPAGIAVHQQRFPTIGAAHKQPRHKGHEKAVRE